MICYFDRAETSFDYNGKGILDNMIISPVVYEELNGSFYLEFSYPMQGKYAKELVPEIIIRSPVANLPDQLFRITERNESLGGVMQIVAHHIFYDLSKNLIEDTYQVNRTGTQALKQLLSNTQFSHSFQGTSNIITANSARLVRLNPVEVLLDGELDNGFQARWGGEIERDNFSISMLSKRGSDNGVQIRDKKNLTGYKSNIDNSSVVTRIMPQGYDGLFLPEKYVDSPLINQYITPRIKVIRYDSVKVGDGEDEYKTEQEAFVALRKLASLEFSKHHIDKPLITYEVEFASLEHTKEYEGFMALETISIGDSVSVVHADDGLNISARMISYTYDPLMKAYKKITLGNIMPKFTDIGKAINRVDSKVEQVQADASFALSSANGKNTNYYGAGAPKTPKLGDLWFKENGEKVEIWIYETRNGITQWFALSNDLTQEQIKLELDDAKEKVDEAIIKSEEAKLAGEDALSAGQEAFEMGNQAKEKANQAILDSKQAVDKANEAFNSASDSAIKVGIPFIVRNWEQGSLNTSNGNEIVSSSTLRSEFIDVTPGEKLISQELNGDSLSVYYHYYALNVDYIDVIPSIKQMTEKLDSGAYTNETIASYLNDKNVPNLSITGGITTNPYSNAGDILIVNKISLEGKSAPQTIIWKGRKDTSNGIVLLYSNGLWEQIGTVSAHSNTIHEWKLSDVQQQGIDEDIYIAFFSIKSGTYSGIFHASTTPYLLNPESKDVYKQISIFSSASVVTVPVNVLKVRVRVATNILPADFNGNVYRASERQDYSKSTSLYSALLMQNNLINLRVAKDDVINQINISTEEILIAGNKIRITGQTTIDSAVIQTAHIASLAVTSAKIASLAVTTAKIADAAITNAKIANLDAGKINTGLLSADRIAAGSITSSKLTIADGFITNAMIANATIQSAKIAAIDAAKITTGTLSAARIAANSITADKVATNFLTALTGNSSIRITGTTIGYYSGSNLVTSIDSQGMNIRKDGVSIGSIGANSVQNHPTWRGLVFDLEYSANYMSWSNRETSSASAYTIKLAWYRSKLQNGMEKGFHFSDTVYFRTSIGTVASTGDTALCNVKVMTLDNLAYLAFETTTGKAGIAMRGSNLILGDDGQWVDFGVIREICKKLAGRTIALPTGFNSNGTATGWYNPQAFNSMTWWNT